MLSGVVCRAYKELKNCGFNLSKLCWELGLAYRSSLVQAMESRYDARRGWILGLYFCFVVMSSTQCDARKSAQKFTFPRPSTRAKIKTSKKLNALKLFGIIEQLDSSNTGPYGVSSPISLPPFDSLAPIPLPGNSPPYCILPPLTPFPPSTTIPAPAGGGSIPSPPIPPSSIPTPSLPTLSPPPGPPGSIPSPNPPEIVPSPPGTTPFPYPPQSVPVPNPPEIVPNPPIYFPSPTVPSLSPPYYVPSPPSYIPGPPTTVPSPFGLIPSPPVFLPPIVYPLPRVPPPPHRGPATALWCVAKPSVPDPIIQEAMDYACASGADCDQIQPNGSCFEPNTLFAHASFAFNSFWQRTKAAGGSCEFGGAAILVTVDPSYDGCHFIYF